MKERHIGQVSFNLLDEYEKELFKHATKEVNGKFSKYIKRLIERDLTNKVIIKVDKNEEINKEEMDPYTSEIIKEYL